MDKNKVDLAFMILVLKAESRPEWISNWVVDVLIEKRR
jgi:hypothetical protein